MTMSLKMNKPDPHHSLVSARWMLRLSMLSVVLLLVWAGLSHIDQVTRAQGQVIAVSRTQSVQAPDGGPVKQILVKEGEVSNLQASVDVLVKISHLADGVAGNATAADQFSDALADLQAAGVNLADATVAKAVANALDGADYAKLPSPAKLQAMPQVPSRTP